MAYRTKYLQARFDNADSKRKLATELYELLARLSFPDGGPAPAAYFGGIEFTNMVVDGVEDEKDTNGIGCLHAYPANKEDRHRIYSEHAAHFVNPYDVVRLRGIVAAYSQGRTINLPHNFSSIISQLENLSDDLIALSAEQKQFNSDDYNQKIGEYLGLLKQKITECREKEVFGGKQDRLGSELDTYVDSGGNLRRSNGEYITSFEDMFGRANKENAIIPDKDSRQPPDDSGPSRGIPDASGRQDHDNPKPPKPLIGGAEAELLTEEAAPAPAVAGVEVPATNRGRVAKPVKGQAIGGVAPPKGFVGDT